MATQESDRAAASGEPHWVLLLMQIFLKITVLSSAPFIALNLAVLTGMTTHNHAVLA
jgi:hypothetical protein